MKLALKLELTLTNFYLNIIQDYSKLFQLCILKNRSFYEWINYGNDRY